MFTLLSILAGCAEPECAEGEGLLTGRVTVEGAASAATSVSVGVDGGARVVENTPTEPDGSFSFCVPAGEWAVDAANESCSDGELVEVVEGEEATIEFDLPSNCDTADKPNLYLYPSAPTPTSVKLGISRQQRVFASDPEYGRGWRGVAMPDGTFSTLGGLAPFLFYEVTLRGDQVARFQTSEGWCVEGDVPTAVDTMAELLARYGFNAGEIDDFVEGWRIDLPQAGAYAVYPQLEVEHAAVLHISPALPVDRLWLLVEEAGSCAGGLPEPVVVPFERTGPHGVEWGVVLRGIAK